MTNALSDKTILRRQHDKENPYFMIAREAVQNRELSYEAIGVLAYLLSKPDDWKVMVVDLQRSGCGRDKTIRILKELTDAGHLHRETGRDDKGHFFYGDYLITERPVTENPLPDEPLPDEPLPDEPLPENPHLHNTDKQSTEAQNTEQEKEIARDSTPMPYHIANGLGQRGYKDKNPLVKAVEESPAYKAYVLGWDEIKPVLVENMADIAFRAVKKLETEISDGTITLSDIEETTRWQCHNPKMTSYPVSFVITDIPNWRRWKRNQEVIPPPRPSSVKGAGLKPAPAIPAAPSVSLGAPTMRGK